MTKQNGDNRTQDPCYVPGEFIPWTGMLCVPTTCSSEIVAYVGSELREATRVVPPGLASCGEDIIMASRERSMSELSSACIRGPDGGLEIGACNSGDRMGTARRQKRARKKTGQKRKNDVKTEDRQPKPVFTNGPAFCKAPVSKR